MLRMTKYALCAGLAMFMLTLSPVTWAQDEEAADEGKIWGVGAAVTYNGKYVWRGQVFSDDPVLQPEAYFTLSPVENLALTGSFWANIEMEDASGDADNPNGGVNLEDHFTEVDWTADITYGFEAGPADAYVSVGYILYQFPAKDSFDGVRPDDVYTGEYYLGAGADFAVADGASVSPSLFFYEDIDDNIGEYFIFELASSIALNDEGTASIDPAISAAYNSNQAQPGNADPHASWADMLITLAFSAQLNDYLYVSPFFTYQLPLDDQYENEFWAGFTVGADY